MNIFCMTFHFPSPASLADSERARANEATRAMTICHGTDRGPLVPRPFCSGGELLFATAPTPGCISHGSEHLAQKHKLDIVLLHCEPASWMMRSHRFSLGVRLFWKVLWHHDLFLWQPEGGGLACFVPSTIDEQIYFWVEDGRLACDRRMPFVDLRDRERGVRAASQALTRLMSEPRNRCPVKTA